MDRTSEDNHSSRPSILVGIPAYNEAATIEEVVTGVRSHADEVLVVDDGSEDETPERARSAGATVIAHEANRGYGATLGTIFRYAHESGAKHLVTVDADGQHDVDDVPELVRTQQETGAQIVTGSRFTEHHSTKIPSYRRFGLAVINLLANLALRVGYSYPTVLDTQCGFRAYDPEAIRTMANAPDIGNGMGASLDILVQAAREGYDIVEVPTRIDYDVDNASTKNPILHGMDLLLSLSLSVTRDRPVRMASFAGVVALTGGMAVLALGQLGATGIYLLVSVMLTLGLVLGVTLSGRALKRSDGTDQ